MKRILAAVVLVAAVAAVAAIADTKPDPNAIAQPDGCQRGQKTSIFLGQAPNWVYVNDDKYPATGPPPPPQWVGGVVQSNDLPDAAARVASSDDPITHSSYDFNIDVKANADSTFLTGASRDNTPARDHLHLERESASFPSFAWPQPGAVVSALGSWVWDCDHYVPNGEQTEFHPFRVLWVERDPGQPSARSPRGESEGDLFVSTDGTPAAAHADCAHRTKGGASFKDCTHSIAQWQDVNGTYAFDLSPPPRPSKTAQLVVRVVDKGSVNAPQVNAVFNNAVVRVSFKVDAPAGQRVVIAKQVFAGWTPLPQARQPWHLRVRFERLLVRRAMDPSCAPDHPDCPAKNESTLLGQIATSPGEWQLYWSVAGTWGSWLPRTLAARDGSVFKSRQTVDAWVAPGQRWSLLLEARDCDLGAVPSFDGVGHPIAPCPVSNEVGNASGDDFAGYLVQHFASPARSLGRHVANASTAGSSCPPSNKNGCYQLTYSVSRVR